MEDQLPNAPYGIVCSIHGKQGLSKENYELQLSLADDLWKCPIETGHEGEVFTTYWDDERYEESEDFDFDDFYDDEPEETKADLDYHERKEEGRSPHFGNDSLPDENW